MSTQGVVRSRVGQVAVVVGLFTVCVGVAATLTGALRPPPPFNLPPELVVGALVFGVCAPLMLARWRTTFWVLLAWFMIEDLIRKSLGNDIRVYFMKDAIFVLLFAGMLMDPSVRGVWRRATSRARLWLYAMIAWSVVMMVPLAFVDWRIPIIALKLDWQYVPLVIPAYLLAIRPGGVRTLLTGIMALAIPACIVGIIQGSIGPSFLRPSLDTPFLMLELTRRHDVFQPTGTFADPGRFGSMALLAYTAALALLVLAYRSSTTRFRVFTLLGLVTTVAAVWIGAGKTSLLVATVFTMMAAFTPGFAERRPASVRALATVGLLVVVALAVFAAFPTLSSNRVLYFQETLDPRVSTNEWSFRFEAWTQGTERGFVIGGLLGAGTGAGSNGLQYIGGTFDFHAITGVEQIEGGYAAVAQQWGLVGILLWLAWTVAWVGRGGRAVFRSRPDPVAGAGLLLLAWMVFFLFVGFVAGFQGFQNYLANAYLWVFSGILFALPGASRLKSATVGVEGERSGESSGVA